MATNFRKSCYFGYIIRTLPLDYEQIDRRLIIAQLRYVLSDFGSNCINCKTILLSHYIEYSKSRTLEMPSRTEYFRELLKAVQSLYKCSQAAVRTREGETYWFEVDVLSILL